MTNGSDSCDIDMFRLLSDEELAIIFAQSKGLLPISVSCCGVSLSYTYRCTTKTNGYYFRCTKDRCRKEVSIRKNSFFEGSSLRIGQILLLMFYYTKGETSIKSLKRKTQISGNTAIVGWLSNCREICGLCFIRNPVVLGGIDRIVEIDETLMVRRKGQHGRIPREQWVFGGYEPGTKEGFLFAVPDRTRATLFPIIRSHILPGTTIYSDEARVYASLIREGYIHRTVNHSIGEWVNARTGCTTNRVESYWSRAKAPHKERRGTHRTTLKSHLVEFMWHEKFKNNFDVFLQHVREVYGFN